MVLIRSVSISNVAPIRHIEFETASRLNLFCGDNGVGKSFILDAMWWTFLENDTPFRGYSAKTDPDTPPQIKLAADTYTPIATYSREQQRWEYSGNPSNLRMPRNALGFYFRVSNDFIFWDPLRSNLPLATALSQEQAWSGRPIDGTQMNIINGLFRDWLTWQRDPDQRKFKTFENVLRKLSPPDLGILKPGEPRRLFTNDALAYPIIRHSYGEVPIIFASAGVKRILTLAYAIVWLWHTHEENAQILGEPPQKTLNVFIDEVENHLHPQWQRKILPALLEVGKCLAPDVNIQFFITTHSPLVLASLEPHFDEERDKLFHLDLVHKNGSGSEVKLKEIPFYKRGSADDWLTDEVFGLDSARSTEAGDAIAEAERLLVLESPDPVEVAAAHQKLVAALPDIDEFWPRWIYFARQHGATK